MQLVAQQLAAEPLVIPLDLAQPDIVSPLTAALGDRPTPLWSDYAASKAYVRFLGQALAEEVRPMGVDVLVVCPGFTRTEFHELAGMNPRLPMEAGQVVAQALHDLRRRTVSVPGALNRLVDVFSRLAPQSLAVRTAGWIIANCRT